MHSIIIAALIVALLQAIYASAENKYPVCDTDEYCDTMENLVFGDKRPINLPPAECGENNICLNPYRNGCLKTLQSS